MGRKPNQLRAFLLSGIILLLVSCASPIGQAETGLAQTDITLAGLAQKPAEVSECVLPACASLGFTQEGQPAQVQGAAPLLRAQGQTGEPWKVDTGMPSPDGAWVAYTSIGNETGGPVFLQNAQTGEWINLIEQVNAHPTGKQPQFAQDYGWDVIGWLPGSAALAIGPVDLSLVLIVDLQTYQANLIPFSGSGRGGRMFVDLAPDGKSILFIGDDAAGGQMMAELDIATGAVVERLHVPYVQGMLSNPRYSPDQSSVAYLVQSGQPEQGLEYAIHLLSRQTGETRVLVQDNLTMTVPKWSPDGQKIAFVRREEALPGFTGQEAGLPAERTNVWVLNMSDGQQAQISFADGFARSPAWAADSQTLAYVLGDGEVRLADLNQPGKTWQAAGATLHPELTNVFFLP